MWSGPKSPQRNSAVDVNYRHKIHWSMYMYYHEMYKICLKHLTNIYIIKDLAMWTVMFKSKRFFSNGNIALKTYCSENNSFQIHLTSFLFGTSATIEFLSLIRISPSLSLFFPSKFVKCDAVRCFDFVRKRRPAVDKYLWNDRTTQLHWGGLFKELGVIAEGARLRGESSVHFRRSQCLMCPILEFYVRKINCTCKFSAFWHPRLLTSPGQLNSV